MKKILSLFLFLVPFSISHIWAQKVEMLVAGTWVDIPAQQTQSELKPGWKIVDYQMKSRLVHYLSGGRATQLADDNCPALRVTPGPDEVLVDYALIRLKRYTEYRKLPKAKLTDNEYRRLELDTFHVRAEGDAFVCQSRQPLQPGEYILVHLLQKPIGELQDFLVYPFCVIRE